MFIKNANVTNDVKLSSTICNWISYDKKVNIWVTNESLTEFNLLDDCTTLKDANMLTVIWCSASSKNEFKCVTENKLWLFSCSCRAFHTSLIISVSRDENVFERRKIRILAKNERMKILSKWNISKKKSVSLKTSFVTLTSKKSFITTITHERIRESEFNAKTKVA